MHSSESLSHCRYTTLQVVSLFEFEDENVKEIESFYNNDPSPWILTKEMLFDAEKVYHSLGSDEVKLLTRSSKLVSGTGIYDQSKIYQANHWNQLSSDTTYALKDTRRTLRR